MNNKKYNLTFPENNIYMVEKFNNGTSINTIAGLFNIKANFDEKICNDIINNLIKSNDSLRIKIYESNNSTYQIIDDYLYEEIEYVDMTGKNEEEIKSYFINIVDKPFKFLNSKLYEIKIIRYDENSGSILIKLHHIISDAWTLGQVANQLVKMYNNSLNNVKEEYIVPSYVDFIESEKEYISSEKYKKDEEFWREYFKDIDEVVSLKTPSSKISTKAKRYSVTLDKDINDKIIEYTKVNKVSPYTLFLSAVSTYIYRVRDKMDFVIGTPVLNRSNFKEKQMMGMFVSTMPTRVKIEENIKFIDLVKQIGTDTMSLFRHQKYPITKILEHIHKTTNVEGKIYNVMLSYQNARSDISENQIYSSTWLFSGNIQDELDIHIMDMDNNGVLNINYDYLTDLFEDLEIEYLHTRIMTIIEHALSDIDVSLEDINIIGDLEQNKLTEYNNTASEYPSDKTVIDLFEQQVKLNPNKIALICENERITYEELSKRADSFANYLSEIKNENIIVNISNSIETIVAIYGILKSGNTYIPVDVSMPIDRLNYIIKDADAKYIISKNRYDNIQNIDISKIETSNKKINNSKSDSIAYIIYTSGTTGNPKGVRILNKSLMNYIYWGSKVYNNTDNKIVMPLFTSIGFDLTVTTIFLPLITGGSIVITNKNIIDIFNTTEINTIKLTPAHFALVNYNIKSYENIKTLILGGEALKTNTCYNYTKYNNLVSIFNEYGPTEATVGCMIYKYNKDKDLDETVKIGIPANNFKLHILNKKRQCVPIGCEGELYISGDGLSIGYVNLEERNREYFKDNMYKTGDIVKLDFDMQMKYIGRLDTQVKINGYRIELDDISNIIAKNFDLKDIVVTTKEINKINNMCVYYVADKVYSEKEFQDLLHTKLPLYMIPNLYFKVKEIPLSINGKVDFRKLDKLSVNINNTNSVDNYKNKLEVIMCNILKELLNTNDVNPNSNIFKLGIDSLTIIKCQIKLAGYNYTVDMQKFYEYPVVRDFCNHILNNHKNETNIMKKDLNEYKDITFAKSNNKQKVENVMLIGATGYLGSHILYELLQNNNIKKIYCVIRGNDYKEKLDRKFSYYFENIDIANQSKVDIIHGDMEQENFAINKEIFKNVDVIINAAAMVKHNGHRSEFEKSNVQTVSNIIKVCIENNIILEHVSTMSIAGINSLETLTENNFYIGQDYDINPYIESKFNAELLIYENIRNNSLKANVYRMGNLTWRLSDGKFQYNVEENAFFMRLKNICDLNAYSSEIEKYDLEFTPVDIAAKNILDLIINKKQTVNLIYHLYNNKVVKFNTLVEVLKERNIILNKVSDEDFVKIIKSHDVKQNILLNEIITYFNSINVKTSNEFTNQSLNNGWPDINKIYIEYIFRYLDN